MVKRTEAGDALSVLIVEALLLSGLLEAIGNQLTKGQKQSAARWKVLAALEEGEKAVAVVARLFGASRQGVQRLANSLARDRLIQFVSNPKDRRADLMRLTSKGKQILSAIQIEQKRWADRVGATINKSRMREMEMALRELKETLSNDLSENLA